MTDKEYNPKDIESKWQAEWEKARIYEAKDGGEGDKYYLLVEFSYPSGNLHVGHWYAFAVPDIYARFLRMQGKNVMYPMGFDAFGLPAENAAIKRGLNPRDWTYDNMDKMRTQLRSMGATFDWSREVVTCDPKYYKWTQWLFLQFLKHDLAYKAKVPINWCPSCKIGLSNEEAVDGKCGRCGAETEEREREQWMLAITKYADRLRDDLDKLDWPESIKSSQRNWIEDMRDWVFSRQRYWGEPIPVIHCEKCGVVPVPEEDLPVELPKIDKYIPGPDGASPLANIHDWVNVDCPKCGGGARRETDVMPNWAGSSWYFLRYADPHNDKEFADKKKLKHWMPVDSYLGGAEHTTLHLLYSRFWHKALYDFGLVNEDEPYLRRMNRGLIMGPDGQKMSKSKGNVIDPDQAVDRLGADTVRTYLAFIGPYNEIGSYPWNPDAAVGVRRFLEKVWRLGESDASPKEDSLTLMHKTIKSVTEDIESLKMNTAVSALMIWVSELEKSRASKGEYETLLKLLAPFAPHMTEELWSQLGHEDSVHLAPWPEYDEQELVQNEVTLVVQVDGKVRGKLEISPDAKEKEAVEKARSLPEVGKWLEGKEIKGVIYKAGRILSFVTRG